MTRLLIGGYTPDKGIGAGIAVIEDGGVTQIVTADSPSWIARHPGLPVLYAVAETDEGGVAAWSLVDGVPAAPLGTGETGGADPCHLAVDSTGRFLVTVNYTGGSVAVHALDDDGRIGTRTDLVQHERLGTHERQAAPHPHMVRVDGVSLLVTDLGGDAVYRYRLDGAGVLHRSAIIDTPPESGPRHIARAGDRWYVTAELSGEVLTFDDNWEFRGAVPLSRTGTQSQPAEIIASTDGRFLYVANRGPDTVSVFALGSTETPTAARDGLPAYVAEVPTGHWPRHIALADGLLYVANQLSDEVMTMRVDPATGVPELFAVVNTPSPTCILA